MGTRDLRVILAGTDSERRHIVELALTDLEPATPTHRAVVGIPAVPQRLVDHRSSSIIITGWR